MEHFSEQVEEPTTSIQAIIFQVGTMKRTFSIIPKTTMTLKLERTHHRNRKVRLAHMVNITNEQVLGNFEPQAPVKTESYVESIEVCIADEGHEKVCKIFPWKI